MPKIQNSYNKPLSLFNFFINFSCLRVAERTIKVFIPGTFFILLSADKTFSALTIISVSLDSIFVSVSKSVCAFMTLCVVVSTYLYEHCAKKVSRS